ncbi:uncharacterized protein KIAA2026-like [Cyprinodon tularosa]|uniref:uncharacterized protein KIAA2026-like n=1 Tax=Cyprinodon tularosa TaxID=77115 RepID=UPI0018E1EC91|nr:uncharacterized protein KIAA2026-like [Cyprinodon tularosa]
MEQRKTADRIPAACSQQVFHGQDLTVMDQTSAAPEPVTDMSLQTKWIGRNSGELLRSEEKLSNGTLKPEASARSPDEDRLSAYPSSELSLPEVCISTNINSFEDDMNYEVQQAYKIFSGFLLDKHKGITSTFLHPIGHHDSQHGIEGLQGLVNSQLRQSMCMRRIEEKFINQEYENITEFVADFRLMLENCYRYYGVDHWISKQAQKLEIMLEQKLTLLSRVLREKTSLAVTSKGRFGAEEERGSGGTSTRRRQASRYLATITGGPHESVMVRALRHEEQQRVKEEKRQRELEKKEAEEMSAKEVGEWERVLLSQAAPHTVSTLWELPAIGHFLCLAQTALNLPEIVFFELERCLLMPRCSLLLSKVMSSLLSVPQRRATLQRRPALPYRRWESELRQRVLGWYRAVGTSHNQPRRAEQLGLCHQFFSVLGEVSPLEEKPFHLLPFYQRVWLLKGLCDHVYETQKDVQDAVLAQPIHECRESILGYDSKENAYIHFPHFCGADLRVYCQSPSAPPAFPFPSVLVSRVETKPGTEEEGSDGIKSESDPNDGYDGGQMDTGQSGHFEKKTPGADGVFKTENGDTCRLKSFSVMDVSKSESCNGDACEDSTLDIKEPPNSLFLTQERLIDSDIIKTERQDPCLNVAEQSYTDRSPSSSVKLGIKTEDVNSSCVNKTSPCLDCLKRIRCEAKSLEDVHCCGKSRPAACLSSQSTRNPIEEREDEKIWAKKKKRKRRQTRELLLGEKRDHKLLQHMDSLRSPPTRNITTVKRKDKKKKYKTGKKPDMLTEVKDETPPAPSFKLVCSNLDELRELISKTEDELDELESMKKRPGRWYYKKEAVKELHSTLIRLLNELLPWEPKLVKAYQRNRLRLKKEFDDFKKHPEYNNFVREECVSSSSSSSSSEDDDDYRKAEVDNIDGRDLEEDDQEHVPRGLWSGASTREPGAESAEEKAVTGSPSNQLKPPLLSKEKGFALLPGIHGVFTSTASTDWRRETRSGIISLNPSGDSSWMAGKPSHTSVSPTSPIINPTCKLPPGYTPIPTLLAKSVGNKVTLMRRPTDFTFDRQLKGSHPNSVVVSPKAQNFPSSDNHLSQPVTTKAPLQTISMGALPRSPQGTVSQTEQESPVQVVCKVSEMIKKDSSISAKIPSVVDKNTVEKVMHQVLFLPSSHVVQKNETKPTFVNPQQSVIQVAVSEAATPVCIATDVPGFSIPDGKIPVQQVAPLTNARTQGNPAPSGSQFLQQGASNLVRPKGGQVCTAKASTLKGGLPSPSAVTTATRAAAAETVKFSEPKQELKTVCIRDSQSILVTTRGGNTGIVKVQASSEQNSLGSFPATPVITISPQLKAFLVSKTSATLAATVPSPSVLETSPSVATTQKHAPLVLTAPQTAINSTTTAVTSSTPIKGSASSPFLPSTVKSTVVVPSLSSSGSSKLSVQEAVSKTVAKRNGTEEISQVTKYILVTSSSSQRTSEGTPFTTQSTTGSGVILINQAGVTTPTTFSGAVPKHMMGQAPLTNPAPRMGRSPAKPAVCVGSEVSKACSSTPQAGITVPLLGKSTRIGQTIGALSHSPSKVSPVPLLGSLGHTAATTTGLVPMTNLFPITNSSSHIDTRTSLSAVSPIKSIPSTSVISQTSRQSSATAVLPPEKTNRKELCNPAATPLSSSLAPVTAPLRNCLAQTRTAFPDQKLLHSRSTPAASTSASSNSASGPVTQRIILNTSTHLTAGTQIVLNNSCFVVPPQGLGPGSHVLIISNPATQMPAATSTNSEAFSPPKGTSPAIVTSQTASLSQSAARLPSMPAVSSQFVACTPALGQSLLASSAHVTPFRLTGAPGMCSTGIPSKTNVVSALPRLPSAPGCTFVLPPVCASTLISSPPRLCSVPALASPVTTTPPSLSSALTTIRVPGTATCTVTSAVSTSVPKLSEPPSALPALLNSSTGAFYNPVPAAIPSAAASLVTDSAVLHRSPSGQQAGPGKMPLTATVPVVQSGTRTQELPTVAIQPILNLASRTQTLPVATVQPIGSTISTFEISSPPASSTLITPTPPVATMMSKSSISQTVLATSPALKTNTVETSALGVHANLPSKLLISTDGAVLSSIQPERTACPKPRSTLVVSLNTSGGVLQTNDSHLQPHGGDTK